LLRKSSFVSGAKVNDELDLLPDRLGQHCPQGCPQPPNADLANGGDVLGEPLSIRDVAKLIGVSAWTVRQRYVPAGLPHFRSTPQGKLLFYKNQVIQWLLAEQQKGGIYR
jgi:hypothetical protein